MKGILLALPPLGDQAAILPYLNGGTRHITRAIDHAQRGISLLREYRTRLISDVVTGKLDVREVAANLPEEPEELEALDEEQGREEGDEASREETEAVPEDAQR